MRRRFEPKLCDHCRMKHVRRPDRNRFCSNRCRMLARSPESHKKGKAKSPAHRAKLRAFYEKKPRQWRHYKFLDRKSRLFDFKSTWERTFAEYLDAEGKSWFYESRLLLSNGLTWRVDFEVVEDGESTYYEVKGYGLREKYNQAVADGIPVVLVEWDSIRILERIRK